MKFLIISTFPQNGSKNIGDKLITDTLIDLLRDIRPDSKFEIVWRADSWDNVKEKVYWADHIVFACLAIRKNITSIYPYINDILSLDVPFSVVSAGTELRVQDDASLGSDIDSETLYICKKISEKAASFTTRGLLSQFFCDNYSINSSFAGDIAFYDKRFNKRNFINYLDIKTIAVSDPHRTKFYHRHLNCLVSELRVLFPNAKIMFVQHGVNKVFSNWCEDNGVTPYKAYLDKKGLDVYDEVDLHVGFRVHAHVSALKRRVYSYLFEQDGRGADYGATFSKNITVECFIKNNIVNLSQVGRMIAMLRHDSEIGFEKFSNLENEINIINHRLATSLAFLKNA